MEDRELLLTFAGAGMRNRPIGCGLPEAVWTTAVERLYAFKDTTFFSEIRDPKVLKALVLRLHANDVPEGLTRALFKNPLVGTDSLLLGQLIATLGFNRKTELCLRAVELVKALRTPGALPSRTYVATRDGICSVR